MRPEIIRAVVVGNGFRMEPGSVVLAGYCAERDAAVDLVFTPDQWEVFLLRALEVHVARRLTNAEARTGAQPSGRLPGVP